MSSLSGQSDFFVRSRFGDLKQEGIQFTYTPQTEAERILFDSLTAPSFPPGHSRNSNVLLLGK